MCNYENMDGLLRKRQNNANFQPGNFSLSNVSSLSSSCIYRKHTSISLWESEDFNVIYIQNVLIFKQHYLYLLHWDNFKVFIWLESILHRNQHIKQQELIQTNWFHQEFLRNLWKNIPQNYSVNNSKIKFHQGYWKKSQSICSSIAFLHQSNK